jgi:hypothetical protein
MPASSLLKHASTDLSGSVFLIDSAGKILSLPIPSRSTQDPLNWSTRKKGFAIFSLTFFATVGLIQLLGLSLVYSSIAKEYATTVSLLTETALYSIADITCTVLGHSSLSSRMVYLSAIINYGSRRFLVGSSLPRHWSETCFLAHILDFGGGNDIGIIHNKLSTDIGGCVFTRTGNVSEV